MPILEVTEFAGMANAGGHVVPTGSLPALGTQFMTFSGTATSFAAFGSSTTFIRLHTDASCRVNVDTQPTATNLGIRLAANQTEYLGVRRGGVLSVIASV